VYPKKDTLFLYDRKVLRGCAFVRIEENRVSVAKKGKWGYNKEKTGGLYADWNGV
jgi:hypothetical protein